MKHISSLLSSVAAHHGTSSEDVRVSLRAYFDHLMEDPEFRAEWELIPKKDGASDEEILLALMIADICTDMTA